MQNAGEVKRKITRPICNGDSLICVSALNECDRFHEVQQRPPCILLPQNGSKGIVRYVSLFPIINAFLIIYYDTAPAAARRYRKKSYFISS